MRLTTLFDYALRTLMYAGAAGDRLVTIEETAKVYGISRAHVRKVVTVLTRSGYLKAVRGRYGGFTLRMDPQDIRLGAIVRATEPDFALAECFTERNRCLVTASCRLPDVLNEALQAFVATLDRHTLADLMLNPADFEVLRPPQGTTRGPDFSDSSQLLR